MVIAGLSITHAFVLVACEPADPLASVSAPHALQQREAVLAPIADAYVKATNRNANVGTATEIRLHGTWTYRGLLRWDAPSLAQAIGGDSLVAARLELTIAEIDNGWGTVGRAVELRRLTAAWTETGATWGCAVDADPTNGLATDCAPGAAWQMAGPTFPWISPPSATQVIRNGQRGVVAFDVTADVAAMVAGTGALNGWVLKKANEAAGGRVDFRTRESAVPPRLVLTLAQADTARPPVSGHPNLPGDSTLTVESPPYDRSQLLFYRHIIGIVFHDSTPGLVVRDVLRRYGGSIIGGVPGGAGDPEYFVQVPDPGPGLATLDSLVQRVQLEPGVKQARKVYYRTPLRLRGRYPTDGVDARRTDWFLPTRATRPLLAIRAPLAWSCENGAYDAVPVTVGVVAGAYRFALRDPAAPAHLLSTLPASANDCSREVPPPVLPNLRASRGSVRH